VHTDAGEMQNEEETEEDGSERAGMKRKRGVVRDDGADLRQEMARLRNENEELKRQGEMQTAQTASLMRQLQELQTLVGARLQNQAHQSHAAPQAHMM
jgi:predicted RNase H-like nuclease (RuvC/YqgF family)